MNNLRKIGLSALAGSLATFSVNAADVSVSGGASITFDDSNRGKGDRGNGFYMGDSLKFNMSGETDGGIGIAVYYEIDGGALDDYNLKMSGDWGSLTFDGHGGSSAFGARVTYFFKFFLASSFLSSFNNKSPNSLYTSGKLSFSSIDSLYNSIAFSLFFSSFFSR